jgi:hypothetical protein
MKTTKDIAEIFCSEIDRISKGEIRKDVITALEKCSNSLVKLARLEMDFAFRNWGEQPPAIPWLATKAINAIPAELPEHLPPSQAATTRVKQLEEEIANVQKQLKTATPTMKTILKDKMTLLQSKLARVDAQQAVESD